MPNSDLASRRSFITSSGQMLGASWLALHWPAISAAAEHAHAVVGDPNAPTLSHLAAEQARDIDAIASQIIPTDDLPGAHEAGVVYFIDRAFTGFFAPHHSEFLANYDRFAAAFASVHPGGRFAGLTGAQQVDYLKRIDTTPFFASMRLLTVLGFLASPQYGGNRDGIGWKLLGFEDQHVFSPPFGYYDRDYPGFVPYKR